MNKKPLNVDPQEIDKFDKMASNWWDPNGPMQPLHRLNPLRCSYVKQHCNIQEQQLLDVGCGGGIFSEALALAGAKVTGIDMSEEALAVAQQHAADQQLDITYHHSSIEVFAAQSDKQYDIITCMELLEHVPDPQQLITACSQLLKPNGYIFFSTINRNAKSYLLAIIGAEYILNLLPKGTHEYAKFIRPSELSRWASQANLSLKNISGMTYHPFTGSFSLGKDVSVNYLAYYQLDK